MAISGWAQISLHENLTPHIRYLKPEAREQRTETRNLKPHI